MPSTFFGLQIAYSGLKASNAALNTTANNVANVETEGYSRQKVKTAASEPMRVFATYGCAGAGVDTLAIERVRDQFYDEKYRDKMAGILERLGYVFDREESNENVVKYMLPKKHYIELHSKLWSFVKGTKIDVLEGMNLTEKFRAVRRALLLQQLRLL